jgi:rare lipoprotein A
MAAVAALLAGCSSAGDDSRSSRPSTYDPKWGVSSSPRLVEDGPVPKGGGYYKVGNPYQVAGRWYQPQHQPGYDASGVASWYGAGFHGRKTSNGEIFDQNALTAAHRTLPMPSYAYVTNLENGRTILVRINDRGPYVNDRIIDLSRASAQALGYFGAGLTRVRVRYAGPAPLDGNDWRERQYLAGRDTGPRVADARPSWTESYVPPPPLPVVPRRQAWSDAYAPPAAPAAPRRDGWSPFTHRAGVRSGVGKTE